MSLAKVPVTIVTGFLGAGKTTLIRHVLEQSDGRHLAVIVNEFGDVGVDGEILRACGIESCREENIVELANGCLCCTVADDFVPAIEALLAHRAVAARAHHRRDVGAGAAQAAGEGVRLARDPRSRSPWTASSPSSTARPSPPAASPTIPTPSLAQREEDSAARPRQPTGGGLRGPAPVRRPRRCSTRSTCCRATASPACSRHRRRDVPRGQGRAESEGRIDAEPSCWASAPRPKTTSPAAPRTTTPRRARSRRLRHLHRRPSRVFESPQHLVDRLVEVAETHDVLRMKGFVEVAGKPMRLLVQGVGARFRHQYDRPWHGRAAPEPAGRDRQKGLDRAGIEQALAAVPA